MSRRHKVNVQVTKEGKDYEKDLSAKKLTDQEIRDHLPQVWKDRSEAGKRAVSVPIPGTPHYT